MNAWMWATRRIRQVLPIVLIVAVAAWLRLSALDLIDFRFDSASALQQAFEISQGQWRFLAHYSGSVINHPPLYLYVLSLGYLVTHDFITIVVYRIVLDLAAVLVSMLICLRHFNTRVALVTGVLFAAAPWAVQFSRGMGIVVPPLLPTLALLGLLEAINKRHKWGWLLAAAGVSLAVGSHLSGVYWLATLFAAAVVWREHLSPKHLLIGLIPLAILAMGYVIGDAGQDFANLRRLVLPPQGSVGLHITLDALKFALWISGGTHLGDLAGPASSAWLAGVPGWISWADMVQLAIFIAGIAITAVIAGRSKHEYATVAQVILLAWLLPVGLQTVQGRPPALHYLLPLYPLPFVLMGFGVDRVWVFAEMRSMTWLWVGWLGRVGIAVGLIWVLGWHVFSTAYLASFVEQHDTSSGGYGRPVRSLSAAARTAAAHSITTHASTGLGDAIVIIRGDNTPWNEPAVIADVVLTGVPHHFLNIENDGVIFSSSPAGSHYILSPGTDAIMLRLNAQLNGTQPISAAVPNRAVPDDATYAYVRTAPLDLTYYRPVSATWASGIALTGYRYALDIARQTLTLDLVFKVEQAPLNNVNYHWFQFIYAKGNSIGQQDGQGVHPFYWRKGDRIVHTFHIALTGIDPASSTVPTPLVVRMGSYGYPELPRVPVTLSYGKVADSVDIVLMP